MWRDWLCLEIQVYTRKRKSILITSIRQMRNFFRNRKPRRAAKSNHCAMTRNSRCPTNCSAAERVSLRSDGNTSYATAKLNQKSQSLAITGVVRRHARKTGHDALIVEVDGKTCWLVVIRTPELDLVFDPRPQPETFQTASRGELPDSY